MPVETFFIIEDIPLRPVISAVTGIAVGTIEGCDFQIQLVQRPDIASKNDTADARKILSPNSKGKRARKAGSLDLTAIITLKESYVPGFMIATGTNKPMLGKRK